MFKLLNVLNFRDYSKKEGVVNFVEEGFEGITKIYNIVSRDSPHNTIHKKIKIKN